MCLQLQQLIRFIVPEVAEGGVTECLLTFTLPSCGPGFRNGARHAPNMRSTEKSLSWSSAQFVVLFFVKLRDCDAHTVEHRGHTGNQQRTVRLT